MSETEQMEQEILELKAKKNVLDFELFKLKWLVARLRLLLRRNGIKDETLEETWK